VECAVEHNVRQVQRRLLDQSPTLERLAREGRLVITGGKYLLDTGEVRFFQ
jgi:hypothetical protein